MIPTSAIADILELAPSLGQRSARRAAAVLWSDFETGAGAGEIEEKFSDWLRRHIAYVASVIELAKTLEERG